MCYTLRAGLAVSADTCANARSSLPGVRAPLLSGPGPQEGVGGGGCEGNHVSPGTEPGALAQGAGGGQSAARTPGDPAFLELRGNLRKRQHQTRGNTGRGKQGGESRAVKYSL